MKIQPSPYVIVIRIVAMNTGEPSPFDGKYLKEYDPTRQGRSPEGRPMIAHVVVTDDIEEALRFKDVKEAIALWRKSDGIRPDGKPNRPLTAFTVDFQRKAASQ